MKTARGLYCCLLLLSFTIPTSAQWQRIVTTSKGGTPDTPEPHPLSYWTGDPFLRDEPNDFCMGCHLENGHLVTEQDYKSECKVIDIGALAGYPIKQFTCHFTGNSEVLTIFSTEEYKLILVKIGPDQYREIYHLQVYGNTFMPLQPARIVDMGTESILATYDPDSGNGDGCSEGYWFFDSSGPHKLDFSAVGAAISERLPHNANFTMSCRALDLDHQQIKTWAQRTDAECHACGGIGEITAQFVFHGARAEPGVIEFKPGADQ